MNERPREPWDELLSVASVGGYLRARKVFREGDSMRVEELGGGVSNIVLAVSCEDTRVVVKQALPRLRVEDEWLAKRERAINEARALRLASTITPGCVPALLDVDSDLCTLTMTAAPSDWTTWKDRLLAGEADAAVALRLGEILAAWHDATFRDEELSGSFGDPEVFDQLRIDPYYRTVSRRRPRLANAVEAYVRQNGRHTHLPRPRGLLAQERADRSRVVGDRLRGRAFRRSRVRCCLHAQPSPPQTTPPRRARRAGSRTV